MSTPNPMRNLVLASLGACLAATPGLAMAHGSSSQLSIQNRFDGKAEVWLDGHFTGIVEGDSTATFTIKPGCVNVVVQRPGTRYVMAQSTLTLAPHTSTTLPVAAPRGTVRVTNSGEIALKVNAEGVTTWVQPGTTVQMTVETGQLEMTASVKDPRGGDWVAVERDMWVEPGQAGNTTFRPDPTVVVLDNNYRIRLHALVDGVDLGWIDPGSEMRVWVRPGPANVVMMDSTGRVRTQASVVVRKGDDARVAANPPVPHAPPGVVVYQPVPVRPPVHVHQPVPVHKPPVVVNTGYRDDHADHPAGCSCGHH
jgi:hypothetical protein